MNCIFIYIYIQLYFTLLTITIILFEYLGNAVSRQWLREHSFVNVLRAIIHKIIPRT